MDDLVQWLGEQLDEDERIARDCEGLMWWNHPENWVSAPQMCRVALAVHAGNRRHIVEHDPARVLREIDAKRELIRRYEAMAADVLVMTGVDSILSEYRRVILPSLALPYADRPGYREEWRP
ncbi:DUF6221 family protein [Streptomyces sp. NPDC050095]|uniref:DUF6221 family protein n=1 Tax=unclassified Streptomyces TaxID=2593676 RepID=UPI0034284D40